MSNFIQQNSTTIDFSNTGNNSWVILSAIERSIKAKIESVGTPLKDWNIQINYGIKTGFNDAFIISTDKKNEILANCSSEEERERTDALIRPVLRGRDIKRYGYDWADLWLIATFPSRHYDIDEYPAVKSYLLSFGKERLEQTGDTHVVNGEKIKSRKKTNNKWFETQDSISYWEDFFKPKLVYMEIQTDNPKDGYPFPCFSYDEEGKIVLNTGYIMNSNSFDIRYILGILNSIIGRQIAKLFVTQLQERQFRMLSQYVNLFPIPLPIEPFYSEIISLTKCLLYNEGEDTETELNKIIAKLYKLDEFEYDYLLGLNS